MRILLCSHVFAPSVGGTETVGRLLAEEFAGAGHEVQVVTESRGAALHPFPVHRGTRGRALLQLVRWADIIFHNNISLRTAWPLLIARKPWFIAHHTWLRGPAGFLKKMALRLGQNIAISSAIAAELPRQTRVIADPYDADLFHVRREIERSRDLLFVGRLVSDKGCDLLLEAIGLLQQRGLTPSITVVGDGPDRDRLQRQASTRVTFVGAQQGESLARIYNQHRVLVVPSRWNEPFGIVALEGIACGCRVIGSARGGLGEAIGPCGSTFPNGDARALANAIQAALAASEDEFARHAEGHLKRHHPAVVAQKYLEAFRSSL